MCAEYAKTFMIVAQLYLEGRDVRRNDDNGSVLLVPAASTNCFDGTGERSPQVSLPGPPTDRLQLTD